MNSRIFADTEMALTVTGPGRLVGSALCSRSSSRLMWVSRERDADGSPVRTRVPVQTVSVFDSRSFSAAGKRYGSTAKLAPPKAVSGVYTDCHGRTVVCMTERFPCFDSYDAMCEDRKYRWWLIIEPERLTRIYAEDGQNKIYVTEDVCELENCVLPALTALGLITEEDK